MKALNDLNVASAAIARELTHLYSQIAELTVALDSEKQKRANALQSANRDRHDLQSQLVTANRQRKRADRKHDAALTQARARAAYYRTKLAEYRRELVATKSILRKQKHD